MIKKNEKWIKWCIKKDYRFETAINFLSKNTLKYR